MAAFEITKHPNLPIILVYLPPFMSWDGLGARLSNELAGLLDKVASPTYVIVDLSMSTPTLLQISNAAARHTKSDWMQHPKLAGVLVISQDADIKKKIMKDLSGVTTVPVKYFVDRPAALRSIGVGITV